MKALVLLSGGVDSTTCLAVAKEKYSEVIALALYYGQKHSKELAAAEKIAAYYNTQLIKLDLTPVFAYSNCSLLQQSTEEIPHESYAGQIKKQHGEPVSTYVPFRNGVFLSVAASIALAQNCSVVYYGAHADDAAGSAYPDCSSDFNNKMNEGIYTGSGRKVQLAAPFVNLSKKDIVAMGLKLKVPYELTWSCYCGGEKPCGSCGTCIDRKAAFAANGVQDPLKYGD